MGLLPIRQTTYTENHDTINYGQLIEPEQAQGEPLYRCGERLALWN